jgi:hypothetical protein
MTLFLSMLAYLGIGIKTDADGNGIREAIYLSSVSAF